MEKLSDAEMAILLLWRDLIRTRKNLYVHPARLHYLMTEMLINYYQQLPEDVRPHRPTEKALIAIGSESGRLSRRREKWQNLWHELCIFWGK